MPTIQTSLRILEFISVSMASTGQTPTMAEIAKQFGMRSTGSVHQHLEKLQERGLIRRQRYSREITIVGQDPPKKRIKKLTHGTNSAYTQGCRCKRCKGEHALYSKNWREARGADVLVKPKKAITHMRRLNAPVKLIGEVAGLSGTVTCRVFKRKWIAKSTEQKILSVTPSRISEYLAVTRKGFVPAGMVKELVDDLLVSGFSKLRLGRETGIDFKIEYEHLQARRARAIENAYRRIGVAA